MKDKKSCVLLQICYMESGAAQEFKLNLASDNYCKVEKQYLGFLLN